MQGFDHVTTWVFDLDNTLYPPADRLFDQIELKMEAWIMRQLGVDLDEARHLRATYWKSHGTTLAGLMDKYGIEPWAFLNDVHDVDMGHMRAAPDLADAITVLPGRKIVYTNGDALYAGRVLEARGLTGVFDAVYGIEHAKWQPKPRRAAFHAIWALDGIDPTRAAMFEDDARNLEVPHADGMQTVLIAPEPAGLPHIHHHSADLTGFLSQVLVSLRAET